MINGQRICVVTPAHDAARMERHGLGRSARFQPSPPPGRDVSAGQAPRRRAA